MLRLSAGIGVLLYGTAMWAQGPQPIRIPPAIAPPGGVATAIIGVVQKEDKSAVAGAIVVAYRTFSPKPLTSRASKAVVAGPDGRFRIDSLDPGAYVVCAEARGTSLLDPCLWDDAPPGVNLALGMTIPVEIRLKTGAKLHVRVDDPQAALAAQTKKSNGGPAYLTGVWTNRKTFQPAPLLSSDPSGDDLEMNVPTERDLQFVFQPGQLKVNDAQDNAVDVSKGPTIVHLNANETARILRFTVKP
jgi:hypothetical protein